MYRILIIEDEHDTAGPVKEALEMYGYEADIAENGAVGVEMLRKKEYDLVLLDLKMPQMNGEEALKKIRETDPYVYVIVYTNYSDFGDIKTMTNLGIDGYVNKGPGADLKELINMIQDKLDPLDSREVKILLDGLPDLPKKEG